MKILPLICFIFLVSSCKDDIEEKYFDDPLSGDRFPAKEVEIDGWNVATINNGEMLIVNVDGQNVIGISTILGSREVTIFSPSTPLGAVRLTDENKDFIYDKITYRNEHVEVSDIGLDGTIDGILDFESRELLINFEGNLYLLSDDENDRHIVVSGKKIPMTYQHNTYVPK